MNTTLVFDYDGTIHNNLVIYEKAFRKCHESLIKDGIIPPEEVTLERLTGWFGMNAKEMWLDFHPELPEDVRDKAARTVTRNLVAEVEQHHAVWYDGAKEMLDSLKESGFRMVILSNCRRIAADSQWKEFDLGKWFLKWYDAESNGWRTKGEIIKDIQKEYPGNFIVIGDRDSDFEGAKAIGAPFIACMYGYARPGELDEAVHKAYDVSEIPKLVTEINS